MFYIYYYVNIKKNPDLKDNIKHYLKTKLGFALINTF